MHFIRSSFFLASVASGFRDSAPAQPVVEQGAAHTNLYNAHFDQLRKQRQLERRQAREVQRAWQQQVKRAAEQKRQKKAEGEKKMKAEKEKKMKAAHGNMKATVGEMLILDPHEVVADLPQMQSGSVQAGGPLLNTEQLNDRGKEAGTVDMIRGDLPIARGGASYAGNNLMGHVNTDPNLDLRPGAFDILAGTGGNDVDQASLQLKATTSPTWWGPGFNWSATSQVEAAQPGALGSLIYASSSDIGESGVAEQEVNGTGRAGTVDVMNLQQTNDAGTQAEIFDPGASNDLLRQEVPFQEEVPFQIDAVTTDTGRAGDAGNVDMIRGDLPIQKQGTSSTGSTSTNDDDVLQDTGSFEPLLTTTTRTNANDAGKAGPPVKQPLTLNDVTKEGSAEDVISIDEN